MPSCCPLLPQVHDVEGGLARAQEILRQVAGFDTVVVEQPEDLKGTILYNVYAMRSSGPA
jgi:hypothetical protein